MTKISSNKSCQGFNLVQKSQWALISDDQDQRETMNKISTKILLISLHIFSDAKIRQKAPNFITKSLIKSNILELENF